MIIEGADAVIRREFRGRGGSNDYTLEWTSVESIVDREGKVLAGVWGGDWTDIARGIETRQVRHKSPEVRIHRSACPVRMCMIDWYEYNSYTDPEHCSSSHRTYWLRVEAGSTPGDGD